MINIRAMLAAILIAGPITSAAAEDGFPSGRPVGHCWACMHGCTPAQDLEYCDWPRSIGRQRDAVTTQSPAPPQCFEVAPGDIRCTGERHQ